MSTARSTASCFSRASTSVERLALEELHREEQPPVVGAPEVEDLDDVLVVDLGDRGGLAAEALDGEVVARQLVVEHLDRDLAAQRDVLGAVDRAGGAWPIFSTAGSDRRAPCRSAGRLGGGAGAPQLRRAAARAEPRVVLLRLPTLRAMLHACLAST